MARKTIKARTAYSLDLAAKICERIASGEPLTKITSDRGMPSYAAACKWLLEHPEFVEMYTRAKEDQADYLADDLIRISDEFPLTDTNGKMDSAWVQWQKNRIDVRKWTAAKLKPRKYGDKVVNEHQGGDPDKPIMQEIKVSFVSAQKPPIAQ
jgi:hypothetical protein